MRRGTTATAAAQVAAQLVSLAVLACLFRLLVPADFGLYGMVLPLLLLLRIAGTLGLNVAAIQSPQLSPAAATSLFWLNLLLGTAGAAVVAAAAPIVAWFYGQPQLVWLTVGLAGTALVGAAGAQHQALLERRMQLARLAAARLAALVFAGAAAVAAAWAGWGPWSLVVQQYVELLLLAVACWAMEPWRPAAPGRGAPVAALVRVGGYYAASNLVFFCMQNVDKFLVGAVLGPRALGLYGQAFNLMMKPVYVLTTPLSGIMLPALSRAVGRPAVYHQLLLAFYRLAAIVLLPAGVGLMLVADLAMAVLGGAAWTEAGPLLAVLSAAILVQGFYNMAGSVYASAGRTGRLLTAALLSTLVALAGYAAGLYIGTRYGRATMGVAAGYAAAMLVVIFTPYMAWCLRTVDMRLAQWWSAVRRAAIAALSMGLVVLSARMVIASLFDVRPAVMLAVLVTLGAVSYAILARAELRWFVEQARRLGAEPSPE